MSTSYTPPVFFEDEKDPFDADDWVLDFSPALILSQLPGMPPVYDTVNQILNITASPNDMTVFQEQLAVGQGGGATAVGFWLQGGSVGSIYQITIEVITNGGRDFSRSVFLTVQQR